MAHFSTQVSTLMTSPVVTLPASARLAAADQLLRERRISSLAVTNAEGHAVGVISRTDLVRVGRVEARSGGRTALLALPDWPVREAMRREVVAVSPDAPISAAARAMSTHRIHRVFVTKGDALVGVLSTKDLLLAIHTERVLLPIRELMSAPAYTVPLTARLSVATDRLERAHVSGLCVIDEDEWPVGTFTQTEALAARELDGETPVESVMSYAMLCLHVKTPLHRAAAYAHATRARRVLAVEDNKVKGVLTGLDFARFVAEA